MLLSDQKVRSLATAGETADAYILAHKETSHPRGAATHKFVGQSDGYSHIQSKNQDLAGRSLISTKKIKA